MPMIGQSLTRRRLLGMLLTAGLSTAGASLLAACGNANLPRDGSTPAPAKPAESKPAAPAATTAPAAPAAAPATSAPAAAAKPTEAPKPAEAAKPTAPAVASNPTPAPSAKRGGRLTITQTGTMTTFDPFITGGQNGIVKRGVYEALVRYKDNLQLEPELAESWEVAKDGKSITLKLRKGVKFHSGREMTADDVLYSVKHAQEESTGSQLRDFFTPITEAKALDKYTVTFGFNAPYAPVFDAMTYLFVLDSGHTGDLKMTAVGTGPFQLADWVPGDRGTFKRFGEYWGAPAPNLDEIILRTIRDPASAIASLKTGEVDVVHNVPLNLYQQLKGQSGVKLDPGSIGSTFTDISVNTKRKPFDDKRVRQAINWAVDRERYQKDIFNGEGHVSASPFPPSSPAFFQDLANSYTYNLEKAKALLAEAGVSNFSTTAMMSRQTSETGVAQAQILQASLEQIGVKLELVNVDGAAFNARSRAGDFDIMFHSGGRSNLEPVSLFRGAVVWRPDDGLTGFNSPRYKGLIDQASNEPDPTKRKEIYRQTVQLVLDESFCMCVGFPPQPWVLGSRVQGFGYDSNGSLFLNTVSVG